MNQFEIERVQKYSNSAAKKIKSGMEFGAAIIATLRENNVGNEAWSKRYRQVKLELQRRSQETRQLQTQRKKEWQ